jgi:hypothetical protein
MKAKLIYILLFICISFTIHAQVGIGTSTPRSTLDVVANNPTGTSTFVDGFIAPSVDRQRMQSMLSIPNGTQVYCNSVATGTATGNATNVTSIGYYYFEGTQWISGRGVTAAANGLSVLNNTTELGGALTKLTTISGLSATNRLRFTATGVDAFNVDSNTFSVDAQNNRVGIGTAAPNAKLDIRTNPTSVVDPGAGLFGIGTSTSAANTAGAGAIRYNTVSGGVIQYSNGTTWNTLSSTVSKSTVIAKKNSTQTIINETFTNVVDWVTLTDINGDFNDAIGVFTAPRTGNYLISFSFNFDSGTINAGSQVEAILASSVGPTNDKKSIVSYPTAGAAQAGATIGFVMRLTAGETVIPSIYHSLGVDKILRVGSGSNDGFVNFSVVEL